METGQTEGVGGDFHCHGGFCGMKRIWRAIIYFGIDATFSQASCWGLGWDWRRSSLCLVLEKEEVKTTSIAF